MDTAELLAFIAETQPTAWKRLLEVHGGPDGVLQQFGDRPARQLDERGSVDVVRHGVNDHGIEVLRTRFLPFNRDDAGGKGNAPDPTGARPPQGSNDETPALRRVQRQGPRPIGQPDAPSVTVCCPLRSAGADAAWRSSPTILTDYADCVGLPLR